MSSKTLIRLLSAATILLSAAPSFALNPQPLPPGMRAPMHMMGTIGGRFSTTTDRAVIARNVARCRVVRVGDPRKQPPMRVCS